MKTETLRMVSPLAGWHGGKHIVAKRIIEKIPPHACYCEPFAGAAWVFFRKPPAKTEVINDINNDVVNLYRVVRFHMDEFVRQCQWMITSRTEYENLLKTDPSTLTDIQRAVRFYYIQLMSFGGRLYGHPSFRMITTDKSIRFNAKKIEKRLYMANQRLSNAIIECLPYSEVITRYDRPHTFFYIDPPYYEKEDRYGKGIFFRDDYVKLAELLAGIHGKFILSLNDTPEIREIFKSFKIESLDNRYYCANRKNVHCDELLIMNFDAQNQEKQNAN